MLGFTKTLFLFALAASAAVAAPTEDKRDRTIHLVQKISNEKSTEIASCANASKDFVRKLKASNACVYKQEPGQERTCTFGSTDVHKPLKTFKDLCKADGEYANFYKLDDTQTTDVYFTRTADFNTQVQVCKGAKLNRIYPNFQIKYDVCNEFQAGTKASAYACINPLKVKNQEEYRQKLIQFGKLCKQAGGAPKGIAQA